MALKFCDSFDHYATANITSKWTSISSGGTLSPTISANGRTGNSLRWTTAGSGVSLKSLTITPAHAPADATVVLGFAYRNTNVTTWFNGYNQGHFLSIWNGDEYKCAISPNADGTWGWGKSTGWANDYMSAGVPVQDNQWAFVELKVLLSNTVGTVTIKVNGTAVMNLSGIDTIGSGAAAWTSIRLFGTAVTQPTITAATVDFDDVYLLDGVNSGITGRPNNDFLGDVTARYLPPTSDSAVTWDRSGGSDNYALVAEGGSVPQAPDDDSTYVSTSTVDEIDYYGFPDVTTGALIYGVQAVALAKKGDTGSAQIAPCVKVSGGSDREHPTPLGIASDSAYGYFCFPWDGSPETGSAWSESEVNGAVFGPRKTA